MSSYNQTDYIKDQLKATYEYLENLNVVFHRSQRFVGWIENEISNHNIVRFPENGIMLNAWGPTVPISKEALNCEEYEVDTIREEMILYIMDELTSHLMGMTFTNYRNTVGL